jgi:two-component system osmolarity sensor histidine kinase EnvZ
MSTTSSPLVDTYLAFARGEEGETAEAVEIGPLLEQMVLRAQRAGAATELAVAQGITSTLRPMAFRRCLANLVDNAARYGKWVKIAAEKSARDILITIEDDGPGIPESLREAVFQPFFRIDAAAAGRPAAPASAQHRPATSSSAMAATSASRPPPGEGPRPCCGLPA